MKRFGMWAGVVVLVLTSTLYADQVTLSNGDRLTGTVVSLVDGTLNFKSAVTGESAIAIADVVTLATDDEVAVHTASGKILNTVLTASQTGTVAVRGGQQLMLTEIASINPPVKAPPKWKGAASLGWTRTSGNTHNETFSASANVGKRRENDRVTLNYDMAQTKADSNKTEDWWRAKGKYDYFFSPNFYGYGDGRYEVDEIANLDKRILVGAGGGYQWIENETMNLGTEVGLANQYTKYDGEGSDSEFSIQAGYNFDWQLTETMYFVHDLTYYPAFSDLSDYYLTTTGELRANFTKTMFGSFKAIFNYDATPATGKGNTDVKYVLGVGITF